MNNDIRIRSAYHEAEHAVAYRAEGRRAQDAVVLSGPSGNRLDQPARPARISDMKNCSTSSIRIVGANGSAPPAPATTVLLLASTIMKLP